ncbi:hypothetical protein ABPG72_017059 [Tetrahymena utriculariae]
MNQKNIIQKTPQFIQFISQFQKQQKNEYAQIFITKSPNSSFFSGQPAAFDNTNSVSSQNSDCSLFGSNQNRTTQSSSSNGKKPSSFQNSNEQIQNQWMKKVDDLNKQAEQANQQNLLKRGKQCVQVNSNLEDIPSQSWKDFQELQKQQILIEEANSNLQAQQKEADKKAELKKQQKKVKRDKNGEVIIKTSKQPENSDQLKERLVLHEQMMLLPKNERNKALLSQKKRDERWDKQALTHKQVAHYSGSATEQDKKRAVEEILAQNQIKKQLKESKKVKLPVIEKEQTDIFDEMIQMLKESGEVKTKKEKKQIKEDLINEIIYEKESQKNKKQNSSSSNGDSGDKDQGKESKGVKRHNEKRKAKKENSDLLQEENNDSNKEQLQKKENKQSNKNGSDNQVQLSVSDKLADFLDNELINPYKKNIRQEKKQSKSKKNQTQEYFEEEIQDEQRNHNQKNGIKKNKNKQFQSFEPYWSSQQINDAIKEKKAFKGVYTANEKNQQLGRIKCDEIDGLVFINSYKYQNRALHNSVVGFAIIQGDPSSRLKNIVGNSDINLKKIQVDNLNENEESLDKSLEEKIDENEEDWETESEDNLPPVDQSKLAAKIVYIFENPYENDKIVGYLDEVQDNRQKMNGKKKYWFIPKYSKLPKMIPVEFSDEFQHQVEENDIDINKTYVVGKIKDWNEESYYPLATISECLGERGDIEVECDTLLKEFDVYNQDFTPETEEYLNKYREQLNEKGEYVIPESEKKIRWDLTKEIICTIDPHDAKDLDDALSIKYLHDDIYEIGVHIADVSHFVQPNTPLDDDARLRTTSVYLVHRVIPMLPRLLCENLCSLNPNVERLAFTVFFQMKENGEVLWDGPIRIGKSVIKSCNKFSYDTVQMMIEKKIKSPEELPEHNIPQQDVDSQKMFDDILLLAKLGMNRRESRFKGGVLSIESVKKRFKLNEKLWPVDFTLEERKDAMFVVEEFMLLANQIVAKEMVKQCKSLAVLRQHGYPSEIKQKQLNVIAKKFGHQIDFSSLQAINQSIEEIKKDDKLSFEKKLFLKKQMFLVLEQALYFVADQLPPSEWKHFALNFDVYTHFTSPIRRYPDLLVHRVMYSILQYKQDAVKYIEKASLLTIMEVCNENKAKSKQVSDNCQKIFMCLYLKDHSVQSKGMVISFGVTSVTIFIPDHEAQRTVYFKDYKNILKSKAVKEKDGNKLMITYKTPNMSRENTVYFHEFSPILVSLTSTDTFPIDYKVKISLPDPDDKKVTHVLE